MIKFQCQCGKKLKAEDEQAGMRAKCSRCGCEVVVPGGIAEPEVSPMPSSIIRSFDLLRSKTVSAFPAEFESRRQQLSEAQVVPDSARCVQCGICSHNCPMGIDVRGHARRGAAIHDSHCLTCSECVDRCPRGVLRFEQLAVFVTEH